MAGFQVAAAGRTDTRSGPRMNFEKLGKSDAERGWVTGWRWARVVQVWIGLDAQSRARIVIMAKKRGATMAYVQVTAAASRANL
jgi:hypothetical protein